MTDRPLKAASSNTTVSDLDACRSSFYKGADTESTIKCFQKLAEADASRGAVINPLSEFLVETGKPEAAETLLKEAIAVRDPFNIDWRLALAHVYLIKGARTEAMEQFNAAIRLNINSEKVFLFADNHALTTGEVSFLEHALEALNNLKKSNEEIEIAKSQYLIALGKPGRLVASSTNAPELSRRRTLVLAEQAYQKNDRATCRSLTTKLKDWPEYRAKALAIEARLYRTEKNERDSLLTYAQCAQLEPKETRCLQGLVEATQTAMAPVGDDLVQWSEQTIVAASNTELGPAWAQAMKNQGRLGELGQKLRTLNTTYPHAHWINEELALVYVDLGNFDLANSTIRSSLENAVRDRGLLTLAAIKWNEGKNDKLKQTKDLLSQKFPAFSSHWLNRSLSAKLIPKTPPSELKPKVELAAKHTEEPAPPAQEVPSPKQEPTERKVASVQTDPELQTESSGKASGAIAVEGGLLYRIKVGETLGQVSQKIYGRKRYQSSIQFKDRSPISDPTGVLAGTELFFPKIPGVRFKVSFDK